MIYLGLFFTRSLVHTSAHRCELLSLLISLISLDGPRSFERPKAECTPISGIEHKRGVVEDRIKRLKRVQYYVEASVSELRDEAAALISATRRGQLVRRSLQFQQQAVAASPITSTLFDEIDTA